jgi:hypothetical protein
LVSHSLTNAYDCQIVPLLRRMIHFKDLTLYLNKKRKRLIDGIHLDKQVLIHMLKLNSLLLIENVLQLIVLYIIP